MPHVEIENEIRATVDEFVAGMRVLARKAVLQTIARHLQVDIDAAGVKVVPLATPIPPGPKPQKAKQAKAPTTRAPRGVRGASRVSASPGAARKNKKAPGARRTAPLPATPETAAPPSAREAVHPAEAVGALSGTQSVPGGEVSVAEPGASTAETTPVGGSVEETAATLLAHIEIEPGQGLEELALAMGTPAAELEDPLKRLLAEGKITETLRQGQAAYDPV